jgi:hypothetical protein
MIDYYLCFVKFNSRNCNWNYNHSYALLYIIIPMTFTFPSSSSIRLHAPTGYTAAPCSPAENSKDQSQSLPFHHTLSRQ